MAEETFNIYYAGEIMEGHSAEAVRAQLAVLFKASDSTLDKLFSGTNQLLRRGCDRDEALKYKKAMEQAGAKPRIARNNDGKDDSKDDVREGMDGKTEHRHETETTALSLAPTGSDVLLPEERTDREPQVIDTSHLSVAETGERLSPTDTVAPPPAPDTSAMTLAPAGEIPPATSIPPPPPPDTSALSLQDALPDIEEAVAAGPPDATAPDFELAAVGSEVLEERYRRRERETPPSESGLELEPRKNPMSR